MEKRRGKKLAFFFGAIFLVLFFFLFNVLSDRVLSYDTNVAHPNIARLAAELYNQKFDPDLSESDIEYIEKGAADEDVPVRWYNHFYDPINNEGLWFGKSFANAKDWAKESRLQNNYALGDQSWNRALYNYSVGDREGALIALGHVVHLLSDMTVPAHTRADIHPTGDSYEQFLKNNWNSVYPQFKDKIKYKEVLSFDSAFDVLATFSNGYFYSDDTIESVKYKKQNISNYKIVNQNVGNPLSFAFGDLDYPLYVSSGVNDWNGKTTIKDVNHPLILTSYSTQLVPKAIGYSAGLIKLFFSESDKGNTGKDVAFAQTTMAGYANTIIGLATNGLISLWDKISDKTLPAPARSEDVSTLSPGQNSAEISQNTVVVTPSVVTVPKTIIAAPPVTQPIIQPVIQQSVVEEIATTQPVVEPIVENILPPITAPVHYGGGGSSIGNSSVVIVTPIVEIVSSTTSTVEIVTTIVEVVSSTIETPSTTPTSTIVIPTSTTSTPPIETPTTTVTSTIDVTTTTPTSSPTSTPTTTIDIATTTPTSSIFTMEVVINEIAWAGTSVVRPYDEWIELYNNTDQDIELFSTNPSSSWKIYVGDIKMGSNKMNNAVIPAHGYYLLEANKDTTIRSITADSVYSLTYGLKDSGADVRLVKPDGSVSDEVDCLASGWFAGDAIKYRSMERLDTTVSGSDPTNWQSNQGPRFSSNWEPIYGSPKSANVSGGLFALNGTQEDDEVVLVKENSPYVLGSYDIPAGKKLTIEAGVIVKSYYDSSVISVRGGGTLQINGTAEEPVFFTSGRDLSQDSNFISNLTPGDSQAKDWRGLRFWAGSIGNLNYLNMRYAGKEFYPNGYIYTVAVSEAIRAEGANVNIQNSNFLHNGDKFIHALSASNLTVENSVFTDGGLAIQVDGGTANLNNNEYLTFTVDPPVEVLILPN